MKMCQCQKPSFAICTPICLSDEGRALLTKYSAYIGKFVCFDCGGVSVCKPDNYDHITGETVARRLDELGVSPAPSRSN